jgi:hypothetical protein
MEIFCFRFHRQAVARARLAPRLTYLVHRQTPPEISLERGMRLIFQYYQDNGIQFDEGSHEADVGSVDKTCPP